MDDQIIDAIVAAGGGQAHRFFVARGLGAAYESAGKFNNIGAKVAAALTSAEAKGEYDQVIADAQERFMGKSPSTRHGRTTALRSGAKAEEIRNRIFVSHASVDRVLAERRVDLLRLGIDNLKAADVLCTSLDGMGIDPGNQNYIDQLRQELINARLVIPLLTPAYFESRMCLVELGGLWAFSELERFPILVPPIGYGDLEKLLGKVQGARIDKSADLSKLHDAVAGLFGSKANTPLWNRHESRFLSDLPAILSELPDRNLVPISEFRALEAKLKKEKKGHRETKAELQKSEEQRQRIADLKDAADVARVMIDDDENEQFRQLARAASDAVSGLSRTVKDAVYLSVGRGEDLFIKHLEDPDASEEAKDAVEAGELDYDEDYGCYSPSQSDRSVQKAVEAINELFDTEWSDELLEAWADDTGKDFDKSLRPVWTALDLL